MRSLAVCPSDWWQDCSLSLSTLQAVYALFPIPDADLPLQFRWLWQPQRCHQGKTHHFCHGRLLWGKVSPGLKVKTNVFWRKLRLHKCPYITKTFLSMPALVHHFGPDCNISTIGWIYCHDNSADSYIPLMMNCNHFYDPLTFRVLQNRWSVFICPILWFSDQNSAKLIIFSHHQLHFVSSSTAFVC